MTIVLGGTAVCSECSRLCPADGPHDCTVRVDRDELKPPPSDPKTSR